jgi:N-acetylmuramoyl-L-alanine amidase
VIVGELRVPRLSARIDSAGPPTRAVMIVSPAGRVVTTTDNNRVLVRVDADALETAFPPSATGLIESIRLGDQPDTVVVTLTRGAGPPRLVVSTADEGTRVIIEIPQGASAEAGRGQTADPRAPVPETRPPGIDTAPAPLAIVIDAGHGGDDVGVRGARGLEEKQLTLDVARRVRSILESRLGLRVILTREDDKTVSLDERAAAANNNKANLLVSLHANGAPSGTPSGAEVFYDRLDREGEAARRLIETQSTALPVIGGGTRSIEIIPWDLAQARHIESSGVLAGVVEEELRKVVPMSPRPKQQAPMRLLSAANMPAVLVEMAYLTNSGQEKQAGTDAFKNGVAQAIVNAIARFRSLTDDRETP